MWQTLAIEIKLIGLQAKPKEGSGIKRPLRDSVEKARAYFKEKFHPTDSKEILGRDVERIKRMFGAERHQNSISKPDNFKIERQFLSADEPGDEQWIFNEKTGELFTYHYDTQKGVGMKYNLSSGLVRSTNPNKIRQYKIFIPGYSHYKVLCSNLATDLTEIFMTGIGRLNEVDVA